MTVHVERLEATDARLGRHVEHDSRSRDYPAATSEPRTVFWPHHGRILNQGQLGCCTGNAAEQALATGALYRRPFRPTERHARQLYSEATRLDGISGSWPPDDTGSSGLAVAKAVQREGLCGTYRHVFGIAHLLGAIAVSHFIVGTVWREAMFTPDPDGTVHVSGKVAGGHEYLCLGFDQGRDAFACVNSWGKWGVPIPQAHVTTGGFWIGRTDMAGLLADQGDAVVLEPPPQ